MLIVLGAVARVARSAVLSARCIDGCLICSLTDYTTLVYSSTDEYSQYVATSTSTSTSHAFPARFLMT